MMAETAPPNIPNTARLTHEGHSVTGVARRSARPQAPRPSEAAFDAFALLRLQDDGCPHSPEDA
jgi:hypothetical protein